MVVVAECLNNQVENIRALKLKERAKTLAREPDTRRDGKRRHVRIPRSLQDLDRYTNHSEAQTSLPSLHELIISFEHTYHLI